MRNKGYSNVWFVFFIIAIIAIVLFFMITVIAGSGYESGMGNKNKIECTAVLSEEYIGYDVNIESVNCVNRGSCLFSIGTFGIFGTEGNVQMLANNYVIDSKTIDTSILTGRQTVILKDCTSYTSGSIRTINNDGNPVDEVSWNVN